MMDDDNELHNELLRQDGIEPTRVSDSEREDFRALLEAESKRLKRMCWIVQIPMWIFALILMLLCMSERLLGQWHIPVTFASIVLMAIVVIPLLIRMTKRLRDQRTKIRRIRALLPEYDKVPPAGIVIVGTKNGKRIIRWPALITLTLLIWLIMAVAANGVYYLLCRRFSSLLILSYSLMMSVAFAAALVRESFKTPLKELTEIKPTFPRTWRRIMKSKISKLTAVFVVIAVIAILAVQYYFAESGEIASGSKDQIATVLRQHHVTSPKELLISQANSMGLWSTAHWVAYSDVIVRAKLLKIGEFSTWQVTKVFCGNVPSTVIDVVNPAPEEETGWIAGIKPVGAERILFLLGDSNPYLPRGIEHGSRYPRELDDVGNEILEVIKSGKYLEVPRDGDSDTRL